MALPGAITRSIEIVFGTSLATDWISPFVELNTEIDRLKKTLELVTGDSDEASSKFNLLKDASYNLGLNIAPLGSSYAKLLESVKGTNLEGATTDKLFLGIASAAAKLGLGGDAAERALKAVEQIASKGKVSLEEVRGQFGDAIPGAVNIFAQAAGVSVAEFYKLVEAGNVTSDVLAKVGDILVDKYGDGSVQVETLQASFGRFSTAVTDVATAIGEAGINDLIRNIVDDASSRLSDLATATRTIDQAFKDVRIAIENEDWEAAFNVINTAAEKALDKLSSSIGGPFLFAKTIRDVVEGALDINQPINIPLSVDPNAISQLRALDNKLLNDINTGLENVSTNAKKVGDSVKDTNEAFKVLGSKERVDDIGKISEALSKIATSPETNGDQFFSVFNANLRKIIDNPEGINGFIAAVQKAFAEKKIDTSQLEAAYAAIGLANDGTLKAVGKLQDGFVSLDKTAKDTNKGLKDKSDELEKNKLKAEEYKIKLEQIASNERIKLIEANVKLNIADIQANAQIVTGILDSLSNSITSTGEVLSSVFGTLGNVTSQFDPRFDIIKTQIDQENDIRKQSFELQKRVSESQIAYNQARTQSLQSGNALVKIDGAGLQPHLEAFMWEILKTIQTRVSQDGLSMLLGTAGGGAA